MVQALNKTIPSYQVDKQQFLEFIAQKAATSPEKLQIQLGQRQIFGQTSEGLFVDELNNGRLQVLIETLQYRSVDKVDNQRYSEQNPEIEIKSEDKILFRQETDGVVSNNIIIPSSQQVPETLVEINLDQSNIAEEEVNKLPNNKTKQFIKTLLKELGQKTQQVVQGVTSLIQLKRDREVASTAIQLLDRHYAKTQEHTYHADGYKISLEDDDIYVVSDRADRELMKIKTGGLTGPEILANQMNKFHYQDFDRARKQIQTLGIEGLSNQPHKRVIQLGNLAPQADSQIVNSIKTQQVKQIAVNFLNATGICSWDAGDKGSYSIDSIDDNNLEIRSTKDERGIILKLSNGRLESNLKAKDFAYFNQLKNYTPVVNKSSHAVVKPPIVNDLANSNLRNLASLIAAKNVLDTFNLKSYESESFQFEKQNNTLVVKAKDGRGEIARLQNGQVTGKVSERDVIHFSSLNQAIQLTSEPSSSLIDLAASKQTKGNLTPSESSYTKLAGGIEME